MNYLLEADDGIEVDRYNFSDVITVGVSRSGKHLLVYIFLNNMGFLLPISL